MEEKADFPLQKSKKQHPPSLRLSTTWGQAHTLGSVSQLLNSRIDCYSVGGGVNHCIFKTDV